MPVLGMDLETISTISSVIYTVATIGLVFLLYRTIKQFEAQVVLSKLQTEQRFRPWIGPINSIKDMGPNTEGKQQFDVSIKNYGEIPAEYVKVYCKVDTKIMDRDFLNSKEGVSSFDLGPMLPTMEKHYWLFVEPELMQKAKEGKETIYTAVYFDYPVTLGKSGYGMISQYLPQTNGFMHKDMWVETPKSLTKAVK